MLKPLKICGLRTPETVLHCLEKSVQFLGFVHVAKSPRYATLDDMAHLVSLVRKHGKNQLSVVLLANACDDVISHVLKQVSPDYLQFHGTESPDRIADIVQKFNCKIIKALNVSCVADVQIHQAYQEYVDYFLYDAKPPTPANGLPDGLLGGHGVSFDWSLLTQTPQAKPYFVAGGIHAGNALDALQQSGANFIDLSSGVESEKGVKSIPMMNALVACF